MALDELEFEDLFERLLQNQELIGKLEEKVKNIEESYPQLNGAEKRKSSIISELENLVIKLYQVSAITIDYNKLMQGEEGIIVYFDMEAIDKKKGKGKGIGKGNQTKSVNFDTMKDPLTKERITELFDEVVSAIKHEFVWPRDVIFAHLDYRNIWFISQSCSSKLVKLITISLGKFVIKLHANKLGTLAFLSNISLSMVTSDPFNMIPILDVNNGPPALNNGNHSWRSRNVLKNKNHNITRILNLYE